MYVSNAKITTYGQGSSVIRAQPGRNGFISRNAGRAWLSRAPALCGAATSPVAQLQPDDRSAEGFAKSFEPGGTSRNAQSRIAVRFDRRHPPLSHEDY